MAVNMANEFAAIINGGAAASSNNSDKPKAKIWLNIGIPIKVKNENGEVVEELLTLPYNLAIDTMKPAEVPTRAKTAKGKLHQQRIIARNQMLERLQKMGEKLEAGEHIEIEGFALQLQKSTEEDDLNEVSNDQNNDFLSGLNRFMMAE